MGPKTNCTQKHVHSLNMNQPLYFTTIGNHTIETHAALSVLQVI